MGIANQEYTELTASIVKVDDQRNCGIGSFAADEVERNTRGDEVTHKGGAIGDLAANIVEQNTRTDEVEHGNCGGIGSEEKETTGKE